jgi:hypothetical protein
VAKNFSRRDAVASVVIGLALGVALYVAVNLFGDGVSLINASVATVFYIVMGAALTWGSNAAFARWRRKRNESKDVAA